MWHPQSAPVTLQLHERGSRAEFSGVMPPAEHQARADPLELLALLQQYILLRPRGIRRGNLRLPAPHPHPAQLASMFTVVVKCKVISDAIYNSLVVFKYF